MKMSSITGHISQRHFERVVGRRWLAGAKGTGKRHFPISFLLNTTPVLFRRWADSLWCGKVGPVPKLTKFWLMKCEGKSLGGVLWKTLSSLTRVRFMKNILSACQHEDNNWSCSSHFTTMRQRSNEFQSSCITEPPRKHQQLFTYRFLVTQEK